MQDSTSRSSRLAAVIAEPYRLFFPVGIALAMVGVSHWLWFALGWTRNYASLFHGLFQIEAFAGCFAVGFMLTALPRFLDTPPAQAWEVGAAIVLLGGAVAALMADRTEAGQILFLATMLHVLFFGLRRFVRRRANPPDEFVFAPFALLHALLGAALIARPLPGFPRLGERLVEQGFLLPLVMAFGTFLGTRLLGYVQPATPSESSGAARQARRKRAIYLALGALLFLSFWIEAGLSRTAGKALRAGVVTAHFGGLLGFYRLPRRKAVASWFFWCSFWFLIAGLWLAALVPAREIALLHVAFIGGFGLQIFLVGLRVTTVHGGFEAFWDANKGTVALIGSCCLVAMGVRVAASFWPARYASMLGAAAVLWDISAVAWALRFVPMMMTTGERKRE